MKAEREQKRWHRQNKEELARQLRERDRKQIRGLRALVKQAKKERADALRSIRSQCRSALVALKQRQRDERAAAIARMRDEREAQRAALRTKCARRREAARDKAHELVSQLDREIAEHRKTIQLVRNAERRRPVAKTTRAERRLESDDEVISNISAELAGVFAAVAPRIKGSARKGRTEAFLQWAQEHPGEVYAIQAEEADADVRRLIREQQAAERKAARPGRYKRSAAALQRELDEVPF